VIFVVLALATWLRSLSYAYWAAAITSVLALLYGYFGAGGSHVLAARLEGIVLGALIAVAVSWLLLPVRTTDVLRRRLADLLTVLGELMAALAADPAELASAVGRFEHALDALEEIARPLHTHRLLLRARGREGAHVADTIDAARRCRAPVASIVALVAGDPALLALRAVAAERKRVAVRIGAARRALAGRREETGEPPAAPGPGGERLSIELSLAALDGALEALALSAGAVATGAGRTYALAPWAKRVNTAAAGLGVKLLNSRP
jgi:uncharacterized membrane protein YccC